MGVYDNLTDLLRTCGALAPEVPGADLDLGAGAAEDVNPEALAGAAAEDVNPEALAGAAAEDVNPELIVELEDGSIKVLKVDPVLFQQLQPAILEGVGEEVELRIDVNGEELTQEMIAAALAAKLEQEEVPVAEEDLSPEAAGGAAEAEDSETTHRILEETVNVIATLAQDQNLVRARDVLERLVKEVKELLSERDPVRVEGVMEIVAEAVQKLAPSPELFNTLEKALDSHPRLAAFRAEIVLEKLGEALEETPVETLEETPGLKVLRALKEVGDAILKIREEEPTQEVLAGAAEDSETTHRSLEETVNVIATLAEDQNLSEEARGALERVADALQVLASNRNIVAVRDVSERVAEAVQEVGSDIEIFKIVSGILASNPDLEKGSTEFVLEELAKLVKAAPVETPNLEVLEALQGVVEVLKEMVIVIDGEVELKFTEESLQKLNKSQEGQEVEKILRTPMPEDHPITPIIKDILGQEKVPLIRPKLPSIEGYEIRELAQQLDLVKDDKGAEHLFLTLKVKLTKK